jgi:hypothetical protein
VSAWPQFLLVFLSRSAAPSCVFSRARDLLLRRSAFVSRQREIDFPGSAFSCARQRFSGLEPFWLCRSFLFLRRRIFPLSAARFRARFGPDSRSGSLFACLPRLSCCLIFLPEISALLTAIKSGKIPFICRVHEIKFLFEV